MVTKGCRRPQYLASPPNLNTHDRLPSPRRTTNVTPISASKASNSVRLSNAPKKLKHEEITLPLSANISREFVLATPKKPKPSNAANNMIGRSVQGPSFTLFKHQAMDLEWLLAREKAGQGGSILAHEMGVVVPSVSLREQWMREIEKFGDGLTAKVHDGHMSIDALMDADIIVSTYQRIERRMSKDPKDPVFLVCWFRVILDESHKIMGLGAWYRACIALPKLHGLCLTGTPFVNKLSDIQPQLRFLEVTDEHAGPAAESTVFTVRGKRGYFSNVSAYVVADLLKDCARYRRKVDVIQLPNLEIKTVRVWQTQGEKVIHDWARSSLKDYDIGWLRARQACDHPFLLMGVLGKIIEEQGLDADVTSDVVDMYRRGLGPDPEVLPLNLQSFAWLFGHAYPSSKICAVMNIIIGVPAGQKVLVFCCFRDTMNLLAVQLRKRKIGMDQYHGELSIKQRTTVLDSFANDSRMKVLLMSIDAGGVGLNITAANHVILVNPWWNRCKEVQAISRCHRFGQEQTVFVYKIITQDSVETDVIKCQEEKKDIIEQVLDLIALPPIT
ncbi:P-loop containing nucleoside triphosphate hydrolase protein [Suillus clintonianus]|uniref:P-loop containing nucleoside triphosphate hydrolase protein n=1 Tax=Suillus clintonianus TaxID=1904413 RepID=UPI001B865A9E|nr:P-loop containing nucleoside triphosphate hydrolase protein [Suillus clintonianus]KAG2147506.1 P-loop containing nucleoside triphosphate hydrolase protein [Suillus clintonianus]